MRRAVEFGEQYKTFSDIENQNVSEGHKSDLETYHDMETENKDYENDEESLVSPLLSIGKNNSIKHKSTTTEVTLEEYMETNTVIFVIMRLYLIY